MLFTGTTYCPDISQTKTKNMLTEKHINDRLKTSARTINVRKEKMATMTLEEQHDLIKFAIESETLALGYVDMAQHAATPSYDIERYLEDALNAALYAGAARRAAQGMTDERVHLFSRGAMAA